MEPGTFSILAISRNEGLIGVAVASGSTAVGSRVPHAKPGVGVIATQAFTNVAYGVKGLELLADGFSPEETLKKLLAADPRREKRQVAILDFAGRKAVFTGMDVPEERGEIVGEDYVVMGNLLKNKKVLETMAANFEHSRGELSIRLAKALKAGSDSGGDKRGEKSAALVVVNIAKVKLSLKVDEHEKPIQELLILLQKR